MRKTFFLAAILFTAFMLNACDNGADSLPELSGMITNALKTNSSETLAKAAPSDAEMKVAMQDYFSDQYKGTEELEQKAKEKAEANRQALTADMNAIVKAGTEKGIDWSKAKMANFSYTDQMTKDGYKKALVEIIISGGNNVYQKVKCDAVQFGKRWYLYGHMQPE